MGTCGLAAGAQDTLDAIQTELERRGMAAVISQVGCVGMCSYEPMVELQAGAKGRLSYGGAAPELVPEIFAAYLDGAPLKKAVVVGQVVPETITVADRTLHTISFLDPERGAADPVRRASNCASF